MLLNSYNETHCEEWNRKPASLPGVQWVLIPIDVISGIGVIVLVLMHSGRGGGLSDMFGAGMGSAAAGSTVVEQNLDRITVLLALVFAFCTLSLALMMDALPS